MTPTEQLAAAVAARKGMFCDVCNMLRLAGECAANGDEEWGGYYEASLQELGRHLKQLKTRWLAGDESVMADFFSLYSIPLEVTNAPV